MSGQMHAPAGVRPHYATTTHGQLRLQLAGGGASRGGAVVVLVGPTRSAAWVAGHLAARVGGRLVVAVEMPGCGGSSRLRAATTIEAAGAAVEALDWARTGTGTCDLVVLDLAVAYAAGVADGLEPATTLVADLDSARGWHAGRRTPPPGEPATDGGHLAALWTFLRDRRLVRADDPRRARTVGPPPPDVPELSDGFVAAATDPAAFATWWRRAADGLEAGAAALAERGATEVDAPDVADAVEALTSSAAAEAPAPTGPPPTAPDVDGALWHAYVATDRGRAHVRRAGSGRGRPVLVLSTGGGSSEQFAPVVHGLAADDRPVAALDYPGNGLSEPGPEHPTIAGLAQDALAVAGALGWDDLDVWGSHTGACVALEMAIAEPGRVGRVVMEAPPMVSDEFRDDLLARYFPDLTPDRFGSHLPRAWAWRRDAFLFWPWYAVDHASARAIGLPCAEDLQRYAVGILESGETYDRAYRAAFDYDTRGRLPLLTRPAIITAGPHDMLANTLQDAADLVPGDLLTLVATPETVWWPDPDADAARATMDLYREFLR